MCCCPLPSSSGRSPANGSVTRSPPRKRRACGWAALCRSAMTPPTAPSSSTLPRPRRSAISSHFIVTLGCVRRVKEETDRLGLMTKRSTTAKGTERGGKPFSRGHLYQLLTNPIYIGQIAHKGQLYPAQHRALIDAEAWRAVWDQLAANATNHRRKADAVAPSLLAALLVDARGERFTPSHAVKKGRRYRYYVSAALITQAGADHAQGWRLPAHKNEDPGIRDLTAARASPAMLLERFGTAGIPSDQTRKMIDRATRLRTTLTRSPAQ